MLHYTTMLINHGSASYPANIAEGLNRLAAEGWRLVTACGELLIGEVCS